MSVSVRAQAWLAARRDDVPDSLWERVTAALDTVTDATTVPDVFKERGIRLQRRLGTEHDDPLDVLAADALITYYCEALAELAPERLAGA